MIRQVQNLIANEIVKKTILPEMIVTLQNQASTGQRLVVNNFADA